MADMSDPYAVYSLGSLQEGHAPRPSARPGVCFEAILAQSVIPPLPLANTMTRAFLCGPYSLTRNEGAAEAAEATEATEAAGAAEAAEAAEATGAAEAAEATGAQGAQGALVAKDKID